jgi:hypothetical protein
MGIPIINVSDLDSIVAGCVAVIDHIREGIIHSVESESPECTAVFIGDSERPKACQDCGCMQFETVAKFAEPYHFLRYDCLQCKGSVAYCSLASTIDGRLFNQCKSLCRLAHNLRMSKSAVIGGLKVEKGSDSLAKSLSLPLTRPGYISLTKPRMRQGRLKLGELPTVPTPTEND